VNQQLLFGSNLNLPEGLILQPDFLAVNEENDLMEVIRWLVIGRVFPSL
jgi:hypothetical protein